MISFRAQNKNLMRKIELLRELVGTPFECVERFVLNTKWLIIDIYVDDSNLR